MEDQLKSHADFPNAHQDGISLFIIIKNLLHMFEECRNLSDVLSDVKERYYSTKQGERQSFQEYYKRFTTQVEVLEQVGVTIEDASLVEQIAADNNRAGAPTPADRTEARDKAIVARFIRGANSRFNGYRYHLRNSFLDGSDHYPGTLHEAYNIMVRREQTATSFSMESDGIAFLQEGYRISAGSIASHVGRWGIMRVILTALV